MYRIEAMAPGENNYNTMTKFEDIVLIQYASLCHLYILHTVWYLRGVILTADNDIIDE